jgi:glycosyltransferase involved in cell wall biosynthesis
MSISRPEAERKVNQARVSVVVPTRSRPDLLAEALDSVKAQSFDAWECLVVDDGPSEATRAVVAARGPRFVYVRPERGGSAAAARNAGIVRARGSLCAFLDDDDRWRSDKLARQVEFLDAHPEVLLVAARMQFFGAASRVWPDAERAGEVGFDALLAGNEIGTSTVVARRAALLAAGCFEPTRPICEDYALWLRLALRGKLVVLPDVLVDYRVHAGSLSHDEARLCLAMADVYGDLRKRGVLDRGRFLAALRNAHRRHAAAVAPHERIAVAATYARRALRFL